MASRDLIDKLEAWGAGRGFSRAGMTVKREEAATQEQLDVVLRRWSDGKGWLARQSGVRALPRETDDPSLGWVVSAELAKGLQSLQVRRDVDRWICVTVSEVTAGDYLTDDVTLLTVEGGAARYRRYWRVPPDGAAEIAACRFVDFDAVEKIEEDT